MIYEISSRRSGKTTRMINQARVNAGVLLVFSSQEKRRLIQEFCVPPAEESRIVTLDEIFSERRRGMSRTGGLEHLYIDNLELVLNHLFVPKGFHIEGFSMTGGA